MFRAQLEEGMGWGDAKQMLYERVERDLAPMRERYAALMERPARIEEILQAGAAKARAILNGQFHVSCDDVAAVALPGFTSTIRRRRITLLVRAEMDTMSTAAVAATDPTLAPPIERSVKRVASLATKEG